MTGGSRWTPPNLITLFRIAVCPAVLLLALAPTFLARASALVLFLVAALSDLWDGYLARKHGWVSDVGKLLDPLADKLLLVSTFVPFYLISRRPGEEVPWWGPLPLWVLVVVFGREIAVTVFRSWAARRGTVIAAGRSGKYKAVFQNIFSGALLAWYPLQQLAFSEGWAGPAWDSWTVFHEGLVGLSLAVAVVLTVYSGIEYFWIYRGAAGAVDGPGAEPGGGRHR